MSCKALGIALKLTFEGDNQLIYPQTYFFMLVVASAVVTQVRLRAAAGGWLWVGAGLVMASTVITQELCGAGWEAAGWVLVHAGFCGGCQLAARLHPPNPGPNPKPTPPTQMNYLNKALDLFNTAVVTPVYYVMFTTATCAASMIMMREQQTVTQVRRKWVGCCRGVENGGGGCGSRAAILRGLNGEGAAGHHTGGVGKDWWGSRAGRCPGVCSAD